MNLIIAFLRYLSSSEKGLKNSGLNGDSYPNLYDAGALLYQLSYQTFLAAASVAQKFDDQIHSLICIVYFSNRDLFLNAWIQNCLFLSRVKGFCKYVTKNCIQHG